MPTIRLVGGLLSSQSEGRWSIVGVPSDDQSGLGPRVFTVRPPISVVDDLFS